MRGSTSPAEEMAYILAHSESRGLIVQDLATLERALPAITRQPATNGNSKNAKVPFADSAPSAHHLGACSPPAYSAADASRMPNQKASRRRCSVPQRAIGVTALFSPPTTFFLL